MSAFTPDTLPSREKFEATLAGAGLPAAEVQRLRRKFYKEVVQPTIRPMTVAQRERHLAAWNKTPTAPPPVASANGPLADAYIGMARQVADEGLAGGIRRNAMQAARRGALTAAESLGVIRREPEAARERIIHGPNNDRWLEAPGGYGEDVESVPYALGSGVGMVAEPTNLLPIGAIKAGPQMAKNVIRGAATVGGVNAAMAGSQSVLADTADGRAIDWERAKESAAWGAALGAPLGGVMGAVAPRSPVMQAAGRAERPVAPEELPDEVVIPRDPGPALAGPAMAPAAVAAGKPKPVAPAAAPGLAGEGPAMVAGNGWVPRAVGPDVAPRGLPDTLEQLRADDLAVHNANVGVAAAQKRAALQAAMSRHRFAANRTMGVDPNSLADPAAYDYFGPYERPAGQEPVRGQSAGQPQPTRPSIGSVQRAEMAEAWQQRAEEGAAWAEHEAVSPAGRRPYVEVAPGLMAPEGARPPVDVAGVPAPPRRAALQPRIVNEEMDAWQQQEAWQEHEAAALPAQDGPDAPTFIEGEGGQLGFGDMLREQARQLHAHADALKAKRQEKRAQGITERHGGPISDEVLEIAMARGLAHVLDGVADLGEFTARLTQEFGEEIEHHARRLWNEARGQAGRMRSMPRARGGPQPPQRIASIPVRSQGPASGVGDYARRVLADQHQARQYEFGVAPERAVQAFKDAHGIDITGAKLVIDDSGVMHARNRHGRGSGDEMPVGPEDFDHVDRAIREGEIRTINPNNGQLMRSDRGLPGAEFWLRVNGHFIVAVVHRARKGDLAVQTVYKLPAGRRLGAAEHGGLMPPEGNPRPYVQDRAESAAPNSTVSQSRDGSKPPGAFGHLRNLLTSVEGSATVEGAVLAPVAPAVAAAGAAVRGAKAVAAAARPLALFPERAVAAAGKTVGTHTAKGEFKAGEVAAGWYDRVVQPLLKPLKGEVPGNDYQALKDKANNRSRNLRKEGEKIARDMVNGMTNEELVDAYRILNDPALAGSEMGRKLEPLRDRITQLSRERLAVGSLNLTQFEAHEGKYVRRLYNDFLDQNPSFARIWGRKVQGSKSRGVKRTMGAAHFEKLDRPWEMVGREGDRVIIDDGAGNRMSVPEKRLGEYEATTWKKLRTLPDGRVEAWRDWTPREREEMHGGENTNAAIAVEATFKQFAKELANGEMLRDIARDPAMAVKVKPGEQPPEGWKLIDGGRNASGLPLWGKLDGHHVRPDVYADLTFANKLMNDKGPWRKIMRGWKLAKTAYNPASHMMNFLQNSATLEMNNGSMLDLPEAVRIFQEQGARFDELAELGLFQDRRLAVDLASHLPTTSVVASPTGFIKRTLAGMAKFHEGVVDTYQAPDDWFRAALVIGLEREGFTTAEAVSIARQRMFHANYNTDLTDKLANSFIPFIRVFVWSADEVPKMVLRHPLKFAKLVGLKWLWDRFAEAQTGQTQEETDARKHLAPEYQQAPLGITQVPWRDSMGQPLHADTSGMLPWEPLAPNTSATLPMVPKGLQPGGPVVNAIEAYMNHDLRTGREIRNPETPLGEQARAVGRYAWDATMPGGFNAASKVADAYAGLPDRQGRRYDVGTAALNFAGTHIQPTPADAYARKMRGFQARIKEAERIQREIARDPRLGEADRAEKLEAQTEVIRDLAEEILAFQERVKPALATPGLRME